eukprot:scaffold3687_cov123-Skeletonema_marinoi.AAC.4
MSSIIQQCTTITLSFMARTRMTWVNFCAIVRRNGILALENREPRYKQLQADVPARSTSQGSQFQGGKT